jgi:hypothetical protein
MSVAKGVVTLTGQESLNGLGVTVACRQAAMIERAKFNCRPVGDKGLQQIGEGGFTPRYLSAMSVAKGVVTLTGQESLNGLGVTLTPTWDKRYPRSGLG